MFLYIVVFFIAISLYISAPYDAESSISAICAVLFTVEAFYTLREDFKRKEYLSFNMIFLLSFFLCTFAFPVFVYGTDAQITSPLSLAVINFDYLPRTSSMGLAAISVYMFAYKIIGRKIRKNHKVGKTLISYIWLSKKIDIFTSIAFLALLSQVLTHRASGGGIAVQGNTYVQSIFEVLIALSLYCKTMSANVRSIVDFIIVNKLALIEIAIIVFFFLIMGDRGVVITCGLIILFVYSECVKSIKLGVLLLFIIAGTIGMFIIRITRVNPDASLSAGDMVAFAEVVSSNMDLSLSSFMVIFSDLTERVEEFCLGLQYVDRSGLYRPFQQLVLTPFYPFPLVPSTLSELLFNQPLYSFNTGIALNNFVGGANFGNHCVGDIYMKWGWIGIVMSFYLFGVVMSLIVNNSKKNIYYSLLYITMMSYALYIPRDQLFATMRPMAYTLFFVWLFISIKCLKIRYE